MRKVYGQSQIATCPFCRATALAKNPQDIPVCVKHAHLAFPEVKCVCGKWLERRESKFGVFFTCMTCGPVSFAKMLETNGDLLARVATQPRTYERERMPQRTNGPSDLSKALRVQEKIRRGQPLSQDELEFI